MELALESGWKRWSRFAPWISVVLVVMAYAGSFSGTLIFDDLRMIAKIAEGAKTWPLGVLAPTGRPVTDFTFALNWVVAGTKAADYHLVNLLIHVMSTLLVYGIVQRTLPTVGERGGHGARAQVTGLVCASLWGVHPLTTSAVTYVSQRYEVLMAFFYLLTLYASIRAQGAQRRAGGWGILAVLACLLGMGSKPVMVTAPLAVLLYDWVFMPRVGVIGFIRRRWPLYAGLFACWFLLIPLTRAPGSVSGAAYVYEGLSPVRYAATQMGVVRRYLRLALLPTGLCFDYGWQAVPRISDAWLPSLVTLPLALGALAGILRRRAWAYPLGFFFLVLAPTSTVLPRPDPIMEHRAYLPLAGLVCVCVTTASMMLAKTGKGRGAFSRSDAAGLMVACCLVGAAIFLTASRNREYRTDVALWQSTTERRPLNVRAWLGLGSSLTRANRQAEARVCFERILALIESGEAGEGAYLRTVEAMTHNNLGALLLSEGKRDEAIKSFDRALEISPDYARAIRNRDRALLMVP